MNIKLEDWNEITYEIEQYAIIELNGEDGHPFDTDLRRDDIAFYQSRSNSAAIGRLLNILAEKGILTAPEVVQVVTGYKHQSEATFTP